MRFAWIPLFVILLEIASKGLVVGPWGETVQQLAGDLGLQITTSHLPGSFVDYLRTGQSAEGWPLFGSLLVIFLLLFRLGRGFLNAAPLTGIGVHLATGGIFAQVIDQLFLGRILRLFQTDVSELTIAFGISDIAIFLGLSLLVYGLVQRQITPRVSVIKLKRGHEQYIEFGGFPRGIDNVHIDVLLSPLFMRTVHALTADLVPRYRKESRHGRSLLTRHQLRSLTEAYVPMVQAALVRISKSRQPAELNLLYTAIIKLIQQQIHAAIDHSLSQLGRPGSITLSSDGAAASARQYQHLYFQVCHCLFSALSRIETEKLAELRLSLFGSSRLLLVEAFNAPLLQAVSPNDDEVMVRYYLLLAHLDSEPNSFARIDSVLGPVFEPNSAALPALEPGVDTAGEPNDDKAGASCREYQRALNRPSVLMQPLNITALLDVRWTRDQIYQARQAKKKHRARSLRRQIRHQRLNLALLRNALEQNQLLTTILAAYEAAKLTDEGQANPTILHKTLDHPGGLSAIRKRLRTTPGLPPFRQLARSYLQIRRKARGDVTDTLLRFMRDFSAYRRDLKLFHDVQQAAAQVHLLTEEKDIRTSRSNRSLHEFLAPSEIEDQKAEIVSHAILKADVRGSTRITEELTRKRLNPATHFSRHFFDPVNKVVQRYGAEKVFIEGDAVILVFNEWDTPHGEHLAVSRACGMAVEMLHILEHQNKLLAGHGLPQLELGIGISFTDTPPRYLFDGDTRITISPAINRADRLSACAWALREWYGDTVLSTTHAAVYEPSPNALKVGQKEATDLVYNLNGIILEPSAFRKLTRELRLRPIENPILEYPGSKLHTARFPDREGSSHTLIIREAPVQIYDPEHQPFDAPFAESRRFYEVVYDGRIVQQLSTQLSRAAGSRNPSLPATGTIKQ
ncbi:adenylate/guanylate cyclase domain-containing protein [Thiohalomonas denitrificans]|uniref:Signal peptidase (SPase) II n=1 Tax=Thiohalomonas denitrificans TaxID=415747 RepID=A0A1G5PRF7_9GAMM|nr:adenylate/guanylate cyclase domain-containing protein [Thiohalomonas denitrificans]SCZ51750.1 Signal peptidase (SPase) II [Thiohalomonas denitrificans]